MNSRALIQRVTYRYSIATGNKSSSKIREEFTTRGRRAPQLRRSRHAAAFVGFPVGRKLPHARAVFFEGFSAPLLRIFSARNRKIGLERKTFLAFAIRVQVVDAKERAKQRIRIPLNSHGRKKASLPDGQVEVVRLRSDEVRG